MERNFITYPKGYGGSKGIFTTPKEFSDAYLKYLVGKGHLKTPEGKPYQLPPVFNLSNIYRLQIIDSDNKKAYLKDINKGIKDISKYLPNKILTLLKTINSETKIKILVDLGDFTDAIILQETGIKRLCKKGNQERKQSLMSVNNLLNLPILTPEQRQSLLNVKADLEELEKPVTYTPLYDLHLHTIHLLPDGKQYFTEDSLLNHDLYLVTHKNVKFPSTKPYNFFASSLQIIICRFLIEEGKVTVGEAYSITKELLNNYLSSYLSGKFKQLATFTIRTVEHSLH